MRRVLFRVEKNGGSYYLVEGNYGLITEQQLLEMINAGEVYHTVLDDGTIDANSIPVINDRTPEVVSDLPVNVDLHLINVCKTIRRLATLDRIKLDESVYSANCGLNTHLLKYIEFCGKTPLDFIKDYLSHLQPYMIEELPGEKYNKKIVCVLDKVYRISVYIKVDTSQHEEIIISFHESNKHGVAKTNSLLSKSSIATQVPVFAEEATSRMGSKYGLRVLIQRGMLVLPISIIGEPYRDFYLVNARDIDNFFLDYCNDYIKDLYTSELSLDFSKVTAFSMLQQISFTSYGRDTFSSLSLLIDSVVTQRDRISRSVASFALTEFTQNLKLTASQAVDLIGLLEEKFRVTSIKGIGDILDYVEDILQKNLVCGNEVSGSVCIERADSFPE